MPLHDVLTALKVLILDKPALPAGGGDRAAAIRSLASGLTLEEAEDLARMPEDRLKTYSNSIFAHQRNLVRSKFPITIKIIAAAAEASGEKFDLMSLISELHSAAPWQSNKVEAFISGAAKFLQESVVVPDAYEPALRSVLALELETFFLLRSLAPLPKLPCGIDLASLTVEQLLELKLTPGPGAVVREFQVDAPLIWEVFRATRTLPETMPAQTTFAIGARDSAGRVSWIKCNLPLAQFFENLPQSFRAEELAERFAEGALGSEEEVLKAFIYFLAELIKSGALELAN